VSGAVPALTFENLTLGYDRHPAVHHLQGQVPEGSLLAVVGPNGAGKSTLLKGIAGVGLPGFQGRAIGSLSGGQLQRLLFARLLLQNARLILLDEPFTAIDARTARDLLDLVGRWHGEGRTVVAVLHDLDLVRERFPQTLLLAREPVAWGPTGDALAAANLLRARRMCEVFDEAGAVCRRAAA
jgi:zinc/manganese transport system ATP-binding protein